MQNPALVTQPAQAFASPKTRKHPPGRELPELKNAIMFLS
jgi:hypothetical protein